MTRYVWVSALKLPPVIGSAIGIMLLAGSGENDGYVGSNNQADGIFEYIGVKRPILMIGSLNGSCILLDRPALQTSPHHVALKHAGRPLITDSYLPTYGT